MSYLIQGIEIRNYQIDKVQPPTIIEDLALKKFIQHNFLKKDTDFKRIYPDAQMLLTQPWKLEAKEIEGWFDRARIGKGIIIWKKID